MADEEEQLFKTEDGYSDTFEDEDEEDVEILEYVDEVDEGYYTPSMTVLVLLSILVVLVGAGVAIGIYFGWDKNTNDDTSPSRPPPSPSPSAAPTPAPIPETEAPTETFFCILCDGGTISEPDKELVFPILELDPATCQEVEDMALAANITQEDCGNFQAVVEENCGCIIPDPTFECPICEDGGEIQIPTGEVDLTEFEIPDVTSITCSDLESIMTPGLVNEVDCPLLQNITDGPCGCEVVTSTPVFVCPICEDGIIRNLDGQVDLGNGVLTSCEDIYQMASEGQFTEAGCALLQPRFVDPCDCGASTSDTAILTSLETIVGEDIYTPGTYEYSAAQWLLYEDPARNRRRLVEQPGDDGGIVFDPVDKPGDVPSIPGGGNDVPDDKPGDGATPPGGNDVPGDGPPEDGDTPGVGPPEDSPANPHDASENINVPLADMTSEEVAQRYLLAFLYFASSDNRQSEWTADCKPLPIDSEETDTSCQYTETIEANKWLSASFECTWGGVVCNSETKQVEEINLSNFGLSQVLPTGILALPSLKGIDFSHNQLSSTVPSEYLDSANNLEELSLKANLLTGSIPPIGNGATLHTLDLSSNDFTSALTLNPAPALKVLKVSNNQLTGDLSVLGQAQSLEEVDWSNNKLGDTLPDELWELENLESLNVGGNFVAGGIPAGLGSLSNLHSLDLNGNLLSGALDASSISALVNLVNLDLSSNTLDGPLPPSMSNLINLELVYLDDNFLTGQVPSEWAALGNLTHLLLGKNKLVGIVPSGVCEISFEQFETDCTGEIDCECCTACCTDEGGCTSITV